MRLLSATMVFVVWMMLPVVKLIFAAIMAEAGCRLKVKMGGEGVQLSPSSCGVAAGEGSGCIDDGILREAAVVVAVS